MKVTVESKGVTLSVEMTVMNLRESEAMFACFQLLEATQKWLTAEDDLVPDLVSPPRGGSSATR